METMSAVSRFIQMRARLTLARIGSLQLQAGPSWLLMGPLLLWAAAGTVLPKLAPELSLGTYWFGASVVLLVFILSLAVRTLLQAVTARHLDLRPRMIALHPGGGIFHEPASGSVKAALLMAGVGAAVSVVAGTVFMGLFLLAIVAGMPLILIAAALCLAGLNWLIAVAALVPVYPFDGWPVVKAWLRRRRGDK